MTLRRLANKMLDYILADDDEKRKKAEADERSTRKRFCDFIEPKNMQASSKSYIEYEIEDDFEKSCNILQLDFQGVNVKKLAVYDFMSKIMFIKKRNDEIEKRNKSKKFQ